MVYLTLRSTDEELIVHLQQQSNEGMCCVKRFKHMALLLHPDKNAHPLAKDAFQKLKAAYDMASYNGASSTSTFNYYN